MRHTKELIAVGILSAGLTASAGTAALVTANLHSDKIVECDKISEPNYKECISGADSLEGVEEGAAVVSVLGMVGITGCGSLLYEGYQTELYSEEPADSSES